MLWLVTDLYDKPLAKQPNLPNLPPKKQGQRRIFHRPSNLYLRRQKVRMPNKRREPLWPRRIQTNPEARARDHADQVLKPEAATGRLIAPAEFVLG